MLISVITSLVVVPGTVTFKIGFELAGRIRQQYKREAEAAAAPDWIHTVGQLDNGFGKTDHGATEFESTRAEAGSAKPSSAMEASVGIATQGDLARLDEEQTKLSEKEKAKKLNQQKRRGAGKPRDLPFVTVMFASAFLYMLFCGLLIVLFGLKFKGSVAQSWLITSLMGVANDQLLMQPGNILGKAIKAAIFFSAAGAANMNLSGLFGDDGDDFQ